jgi:hypothetical protein
MIDTDGPTIVNFAVEDTKGWAQLVRLHNFPGVFRAKGRELDTIFPLNSILFICEPHVTAGEGDFRSHIIVESPSDIIFTNLDSPILKNISWATGGSIPFRTNRSVSEWKTVGDKHLTENEYFAASIAYTNIIQSNPTDIPLRLNRCLAYLRSGDYVRTLHDAKFVIESPGVGKRDKVKALYWAGQAEYGDAHYLSAQGWYAKCLEMDPKFRDAEVGLRQCEARLHEENSGDYDWETLHKGSFRHGYRPDVANFRGPVTISHLPNRGGGRGLTATRDILAGELLVSDVVVVVADQE